MDIKELKKIVDNNKFDVVQTYINEYYEILSNTINNIDSLKTAISFKEKLKIFYEFVGYAYTRFAIEMNNKIPNIVILANERENVYDKIDNIINMFKFVERAVNNMTENDKKEFIKNSYDKDKLINFGFRYYKFTYYKEFEQFDTITKIDIVNVTKNEIKKRIINN